MKEALFYQHKLDDMVQCNLCPHHCVIKKGRTGLCHVRKNVDGSLYSLVYGNPIALSVDPIEKKPLFHFYPGSTTYSIATVGCNMKCLHCQNADISQQISDPSLKNDVSAEHIVNQALKKNTTSIAYTYTEPTIFYEYSYDIAKCAHQNGLKNVFVTNGFIEKEPLHEISSCIDAVNIDLKAMSEEFYKNICGAHLKPVLEAIKMYYDLGVWIEITTLFIPGYNDNEQTMNKIASFIADINSDIPWHVTGFHPSYKLTDTHPTSLSTLDKAVNLGKKQGLHYIYQGNRGTGEDTVCPHCGKVLISRSLFTMRSNIIMNASCPSCGTYIPGIGIKELDKKNEV